jgi:predicted transcriptional regulator
VEEPEIERIEERGEAVLASVPDYVWNGRELPVPVEDIVENEFGLLVRDVEDMTAAPGCPPVEPGHSLSGLLLSDRRQIWVNAKEAERWPPRRRFTIGHELGHWVMHSDEQASLFCRHGAVDPEEKDKDDSKRPSLPLIEEEANHFAAALLMPRQTLQRLYRSHEGDRDRFQRLRATFGVSGAALGRRLHQVI